MASTPYHHGNLREALVDAAVEVVRECGQDGLAVRDLARRVGVSHNAAYRHFANRDDLVAEVAGRVMQQLVEAMERQVAAVDATEPVLRARRRLAAVGRAYVEFAVAEPGLFRLAFSSYAVVAAATPPTERDPYALLGRVLDDLVDVGFLATEARESADLTCWAAVHGLAVLTTDGALRGADEAKRSFALRQLLDTIDRSYGASTGTPTSIGDLYA